MKSKKFKLPNFWDIADIPETIELNPLELFIYNNEPAGKYEKSFRKELENAIRFVLEEDK